MNCLFYFGVLTFTENVVLFTYQEVSKRKETMMGASEHIKAALKANRITQDELAKRVDKPTQTVYNMMFRDTMKFNMVETYADAIGCDVVLRDRETGECY